MGKLRLKTGEVLELPLEEAVEFMLENPDLIAALKSGKPRQKRREVILQGEVQSVSSDQ